MMALLVAAVGFAAMAAVRLPTRPVESCARCGAELGKRGCPGCGWPFR